jgi:hypothetical protein
MRLRELIRESEGESDSGSAQGGAGLSGSRQKLNPNQSSSIPGMATYPDLPSHYYDMYRFGVHMAGSPNNQTMARVGPAANEFVTVAFTDADAHIINTSRKAMGLKQKAISTKGSQESENINKKSAVATPKKNKYGI